MAMVTITVLQLLVMIMITAPPNLGQRVRMTAHITLSSLHRYLQVTPGIYMYLHVLTCIYIHLHTFIYIYIYLHIFTCIYRYFPVILGIYRYLLGGGGRVDSSVLPSTGQTWGSPGVIPWDTWPEVWWSWWWWWWWSSDWSFLCTGWWPLTSLSISPLSS